MLTADDTGCAHCRRIAKTYRGFTRMIADWSAKAKQQLARRSWHTEANCHLLIAICLSDPR
jgi:hypothetical protein